MICTATGTDRNRSIEVDGEKAVTYDPDIAGIGVVIGFVLSAYVTLILVIIHFILNYRNTRNLIDRAWIKFLTPKAWNDPQARPSKKWTLALESAVLMYSDTQVLTGIAILLCAYFQLGRRISVYHWQVTVQLAWFSSVTHLTTLTSLHAYFRERPMMAFWRTFFMGVTLLLLAIALGPTGYINKKGPDHDHFDTKAVPAVCLYLNGHLFGSFNKALINLSLLMLLTSYVTRVVQLFTPLSKLAKEYLRTAPGNLMKKYLERGDNLHFFAMLAYVLFKAIYDIAQSMLFEIIWLVLALAWGTLRLIFVRIEAYKVSDQDDRVSEEMLWGFGQFLAVILSTFPLWSIYTRIQEIAYEDSKRTSSIPTSSVPAISISASLNSTSHRQFSHSSLYQTVWFPKLIILMFAVVLDIAADILLLPGFPTFLSEKSTAQIILYFCERVGFTIFVLVLFICQCLVFQHKADNSTVLQGLKRLFEKLDKKKQRIVWTFLIVFFLGVSEIPRLISLSYATKLRK